MPNDELSWSDTHLVQAALEGNEEAWLALINRYKNLIYSIPVRYGLSRDDAVDVFQAVVAELLAGLSAVRQPQALQAWLVQVTSHKCLRLAKERQREGPVADWEFAENMAADDPGFAESVMAQLQSEQILRRALQTLPPQCRQMIEMLFYENPPRPYTDVANALGIAVGSIGLTRRRCLERLRKLLDEAGYA